MERFRNWQFEQLRKAVQSVQSILATTSPEAARTYRDGGNSWTALEVLCHLRDWDKIISERAHLTIEQDFPTLPNPNPDELAVKGKYNEQDLQAVLADWAQLRESLIGYLQTIAEADWERAGNHPRRGHFTLHDQLFLTTWHDMNHIEQITRILAEKKTQSINRSPYKI